MKNADYVLIIGFEDKASDSGDNEILKGSRALAQKAALAGKKVDCLFYIYDGNQFVGTSYYMLEMNPLMSKKGLDPIRAAIAKLTDNSELILRGHGNAMSATLSKIGPNAMANFLLGCGLNKNCKINVTSCKLGRGPTQLGADANSINALDISEGSWARTFLDQLIKAGLRNELHARVQNVIIKSNGSKTTRKHGSDISGDHEHKQSNSKIIFKCDASGFASAAYAY